MGFDLFFLYHCRVTLTGNQSSLKEAGVVFWLLLDYICAGLGITTILLWSLCKLLPESQRLAWLSTNNYREFYCLEWKIQLYMSKSCLNILFLKNHHEITGRYFNVLRQKYLHEVIFFVTSPPPTSWKCELQKLWWVSKMTTYMK